MIMHFIKSFGIATVVLKAASVNAGCRDTDIFLIDAIVRGM